MTRRIITIAAVLLLLAALSYPLQARLTGDEAPASAPLAGDTPGTGLTEIDRLIGVYEDRIAVRETATEYALLGDLYLQRADFTRDPDAYRSADAVLGRLLELDPGSNTARLGLARTAVALHDFERARDLAAAVLDDEPRDVQASLVAADAALAVGAFDAADGHLAYLDSVAPSDPAVLVRRAELAAATGDREGAIELARDAVAAVPDDGRPSAFYETYLGALLTDGGDYSAAVDVLEGAVVNDRRSAGAHAELGRALSAAGRTDEAVVAYERAVALTPAPAHLAALADLHEITGNPEGAARHRATVEAIAALDDGVYNRALAGIFADLDIRTEEAVVLAATDAAGRDDAGAHDTLGWALFRAGRLDEARSDLDRALEIDPSDAESWYHTARISEALGEPARAASEAERALELSPEFDPIHAPEARALVERTRR